MGSGQGPARADVIVGVRGLKTKDGPDLIIWGSSTLTSVLLGQGLVDEVVLIVYPVLPAKTHESRILRKKSDGFLFTK
jgi:hypothetical protein